MLIMAGCPQCTFENDPKKSSCNACEARKSKFGSMPNVAGQIPQSEWICQSCSYNNPPDRRQKCEICDLPRLISESITFSSIRRISSVTNNLSFWKCPKCTSEHDDSDSICKKCQFRRQIWNCSQCTLENTIEKANCQACGSNNPARPKFPIALENYVKNTLLPPRIESDFLENLRQNDEQKARHIFSQIVNFCRENHKKYVDDTFPVNKFSIGRLSNLPFNFPSFRSIDNLKWLRPEDIFTKDGLKWRWAIFRNPHPTDIEQGVLGNCWFLSALAVIAERSDILEKIIPTRTYSFEGVYQIRLCVDGKWRIVTVDDFFPCYQDGTMAFSVGRRNQLWVPLIEKALAKAAGSYQALQAGRSVEGLMLLTGAPCDTLCMEDADLHQQTVDLHLLWARLLSAREAQFLMGCSCGAGSRSVDENLYTRMGLQARHAYSILDVRDIDGIRLVCLRNPWGQFVWTGAYSEHCPLWTSSLCRRLNRPRSGSGIFWMSFDDFRLFFDSVDICKVRTHGRWEELRLPAMLTMQTTRATRLVQTSCSESRNVVSTRGELEIVDSVPPLHRQILIILSHLEPSQSYYVQHHIRLRRTVHSGLRDWAPKKSDKNVNHIPPLDQSIQGLLHSPRPLFYC